MAIVDNNIVSSLAKVDRLALLPSVFETVETIPSVIDELDRAAVEGYEFVARIDAVKSYNMAGSRSPPWPTLNGNTRTSSATTRFR